MARRCSIKKMFWKLPKTHRKTRCEFCKKYLGQVFCRAGSSGCFYCVICKFRKIPRKRFAMQFTFGNFLGLQYKFSGRLLFRKNIVIYIKSIFKNIKMKAKISCVYYANFHLTQQTNICSKSAKETQEKGVKYVC